MGVIVGLIRGDARSLDYSSAGILRNRVFCAHGWVEGLGAGQQPRKSTKHKLAFSPDSGFDLHVQTAVLQHDPRRMPHWTF